MHPEREAFLRAIKSNPHDYVTRHVFADWLEDHDEPEEATRQRRWKESWEWLAGFAEACEMTPDRLVEIATRYLDSDGHYWHTLGFNTPDVVYDGKEVLWEHYEVVTGRQVPGSRKRDTFISCAC